MSNARVIYLQDPSDQWYTPRAIRELVWHALSPGSIDLDPCTSARNPMRARTHYTARGLERPWHGLVFLNPPYGRGIDHWITAAMAHATKPGCAALALVPARPGAAWYARATFYAALVCELHGRLTFERRDGRPSPYPARWGSALLLWEPEGMRHSLAGKLAQAFNSAAVSRLAHVADPFAIAQRSRPSAAVSRAGRKEP